MNCVIIISRIGDFPTAPIIYWKSPCPQVTHFFKSLAVSLDWLSEQSWFSYSRYLGTWKTWLLRTRTFRPPKIVGQMDLARLVDICHDLPWLFYVHFNWSYNSVELISNHVQSVHFTETRFSHCQPLSPMSITVYYHWPSCWLSIDGPRLWWQRSKNVARLESVSKCISCLNHSRSGFWYLRILRYLT